MHLLAAPRPSRLLCVRRPLAGRFVTGAKVTATDGGHQEPESATMSTSDLSQAKQCVLSAIERRKIGGEILLCHTLFSVCFQETYAPTY